MNRQKNIMQETRDSKLAQRDYFKRVARLTPTKMWINNVTREEAEWALMAGAKGCTQNPSYTWKMLTHEREGDYAKQLLRETLTETDDDNDVICRLQRKLIYGVSQKFMPLWEQTHGQHGYVSIQGDPIHEDDAQVIIQEARNNRQLNPNMMIKIPATKAGLEAMRVLIAEDTPLNATEVMGVSQMVALCEMYREVVAETGKRPMMYVSLITGIYDEWLQKDIQEKGIAINPDVAKQAGMVIAKKVYQLMHDRGYKNGFIGGGVRGIHHFTEMVGGDVCITMNWQGQVDGLLQLDLPVVARLFNPVQPEVLETLLDRLPQFRKAYFEHGLAVSEFAEYEPVEYFRHMFVTAWENCVSLAASMRE
ncbi:transaldolase family protein [Parapedobacter sp. 2B3]